MYLLSNISVLYIFWTTREPREPAIASALSKNIGCRDFIAGIISRIVRWFLNRVVSLCLAKRRSNISRNTVELAVDINNAPNVRLNLRILTSFAQSIHEHFHLLFSFTARKRNTTNNQRKRLLTRLNNTSFFADITPASFCYIVFPLPICPLTVTAAAGTARYLSDVLFLMYY